MIIGRRRINKEIFINLMIKIKAFLWGNCLLREWAVMRLCRKRKFHLVIHSHIFFKLECICNRLFSKNFKLVISQKETCQSNLLILLNWHHFHWMNDAARGWVVRGSSENYFKGPGFNSLHIAIFFYCRNGLSNRWTDLNTAVQHCILLYLISTE